MAIRRKDPEYTQSMYGLLAILSQGPMSGYDVRKTLDDREMYYWRESSGNIYPMLRQLNQDGLLDKTDAYTKKKKRVLYSLTERGRTELDAWLAEPAGLNRFRVELLMKLRFGTGLGLETLMSHLENYKHRIQEQLDEVREILSEIDESGDSLENDMRRIAVMRFSLDTGSRLKMVRPFQGDPFETPDRQVDRNPVDTLAEAVRRGRTELPGILPGGSLGRSHGDAVKKCPCF